MNPWRTLTLSALGALLIVGDAEAQVSFPDTPQALVDALASDAFQKDLVFRKFIRASAEFVLDRESTETCSPSDPACKPFTQAVQQHLQVQLQDERAAQMFVTTAFIAPSLSEPIDLYLLMGQSNMVGLTESGSYNGPDEEIQAELQAATPGRAVVTLNCALNASLLNAWEPQTISFVNFFETKERHSLARECIESARAVRNSLGTRANVRGLFFFQGESDVALAAALGGDGLVTSWGDRYRAFIEFMRIEFGDVPAVHAQLGKVVSTAPNVQVFTVQMRQVQASVPNVLERSATIVTEDLTLADTIHLDDASQAIAGRRFAAAMLTLLDP